ncbi:MAG: hypothetical protein H7832_10890 [Magnetococcus sp. DMHC-6]
MYTCLFLSGFFLLISGPILAQESPTVANSATASKWGQDKEQIASRLERTATLLETSSGAIKIQESSSSEAKALLDEARAIMKKARSSYESGNYEESSKLMGEATQKMFTGVRLADGGQSNKVKNENDFERRLQSVEVLLDAHRRISKEKGLKDESKPIESLMLQAKELASKGNVQDGRVKLDEAYVTAKLGIEKMRRGDTLVRTLNFASKEEEYHYELDRNDTHQMLIKMLLDSKGDSVRSMAAPLVAKATELRTQAEAQANHKEFEKAIATLEESTAELVRAIRGAGIYIPG